MKANTDNFKALIYCLFSLSLILFSTKSFGAIIKVPTEYPTIQAAIDAATSGDTVLVSDGIYIGPGNKNLDATGKEFLTVKSENGPANCIIDCQGVGFGFDTGSFVLLDVEGFTIRNCQIGVRHFAVEEEGALRVRNCLIVRNTVGISTNVGSVYDSFISDNDGTGFSAGADNVGYYSLIRCIITGNGTGVYGYDASGIIRNCIIADNESTGGIFQEGGHLTIVNSTITGNSTTDSYGGGGMHFWGGPAFTVINSIFWGNTPNNIYFPAHVTADVTYSDIDQDGFAGGIGNIREDPLFLMNYSVGDVIEQYNTFHLRSDSPCMDTGTSQNAPPDDIDGDPRPWGAGVDMGADECIPPEDYWTDDRMRDAVPPPMGIVVPMSESEQNMSEENELQEDVNPGFAPGSDFPLITD